VLINDAKRRSRLIASFTFLAIVGICASGWKSYSNAAMAGPKGQFGVNGEETLRYLRSLDFTI